jgi:hypothetical protein
MKQSQPRRGLRWPKSFQIGEIRPIHREDVVEAFEVLATQLPGAQSREVVPASPRRRDGAPIG